MHKMISSSVRTSYSFTVTFSSYSEWSDSEVDHRFDVRVLKYDSDERGTGTISPCPSKELYSKLWPELCGIQDELGFKVDWNVNIENPKWDEFDAMQMEDRYIAVSLHKYILEQ